MCFDGTPLKGDKGLYPYKLFQTDSGTFPKSHPLFTAGISLLHPVLHWRRYREQGEVTGLTVKSPCFWNWLSLTTLGTLGFLERLEVNFLILKLKQRRGSYQRAQGDRSWGKQKRASLFPRPPLDPVWRRGTFLMLGQVLITLVIASRSVRGEDVGWKLVGLWRALGERERDVQAGIATHHRPTWVTRFLKNEWQAPGCVLFWEPRLGCQPARAHMPHWAFTSCYQKSATLP